VHTQAWGLIQTHKHAAVDRPLSRAIARSRAVRASVARRRRRRIALAACASALVGVPIAWFMAEPATAVAIAAASEVQDFADMLASRSPGARTQAELTKHARPAPKFVARPKQPPAHPTLPGVPSTPALVDLLMPPVAPVEIAANGPPPITPPPALGTILASTPGSSSIVPPSGGGPATYPTAQPREEVPVTSAVPEPGTWATMLLGFGLIAWRMRRRRPTATVRSARL
jgi:hypothetical protein